MNFTKLRDVLLLQLPIPPLGPEPIRGNVPLAAAYLKLFAERKGLGDFCNIEIFPTPLSNTLGDQALVEAVAARDPWLVGFTCYLWNIERTLWIARELKRRRSDIRIIFGGPEITTDNAWVLNSPDYDFAVIGEGEQTFAEMLCGLVANDNGPLSIPGLFIPTTGSGHRYDPSLKPSPRSPLPDLTQLGSPYLAGILDVADEQMLLLETSRGCRYRCRFCYYWKSYQDTYYLGDEAIRASLRLAGDRGAREVFLLDPTLNQRKGFADLLRLLADCNPGHRFTYFAELRGEGITQETARLLRHANFTEVEVGLQSVDPNAMELMDRKNNLKAFERGVRAMMDQGIRVKVDLIIGLPGDTVESVRRGLHFIHDKALCSDIQVFNLAVLPGTAFREDAAKLGLLFQPRPPYYVLQTPTLDREDLFGLMDEAQELFATEFDAMPIPVLDFPEGDLRAWRIDLDCNHRHAPPSSKHRPQAFTLWLKSARLSNHRREITTLIRSVLDANPFTTLQVVLEPIGDLTSQQICHQIEPLLLSEFFAACQANPTYLDKSYALQPGKTNGAKRLVLIIRQDLRDLLPPPWIKAVGEFATLAWRDGVDKIETEEEIESFDLEHRAIALSGHPIEGL
jgi:radical SAM superfamily enzyme YgiQ (UPF0313 family)